jgi:hypothetical protein
MKPNIAKTINQDRLATWEEVRRATTSTPDQFLQYFVDQGSFCEMSSDLGGIIRYPAEEFEFFAYLSELDESSTN